MGHLKKELRNYRNPKKTLTQTDPGVQLSSNIARSSNTQAPAFSLPSTAIASPNMVTVSGGFLDLARMIDKTVARPANSATGDKFNLIGLTPPNEHPDSCHSRCTWIEKTVCTGFPSIWSDYREKNDLCDCSIRSTDGKIYHVHRAILASASPQIRAFFKSALQEEDGDITVSCLPSTTLSGIIEFSYTGHTTICQANAHQLLMIAGQFQMLPLIQACIHYLQENITLNSCLDVFKICRTYYCQQTFARAREYMLFHFKDIVHLTKFKELASRDIVDYLQDDFLNAKSEEMVFEAVKSWIEHDPENRMDKVVQLLQCVRFGHTTYQYFTTKVLVWELIQGNQEAEAALFDAFKFLAQIILSPGSPIDLNNPWIRPRVPPEIIFTIGGWISQSPTNVMEIYDPRIYRWLLVKGTNVAPRAYHGLVTSDRLVYMIGGFDGADTFYKTVLCFNPVTKKWMEKSCMHYPRCFVSTCTVDGLIYAMGGLNGHGRMNSAERYDIKRNQWDMIASMNRQRSDASACSLMGKVYVAGGSNGLDFYDSVEVYDSTAGPDGVWTFIDPMGSARSGLAITVYEGQVYALGGFDGAVRLNTAERFNPLGPRGWHAIADMSTPRSNFATAVIDNMIFAMGGFNGERITSSVECYDVTSNKWFNIPHMNRSRSAMGAVVLRGLPNGREYSSYARAPRNSSKRRDAELKLQRNARRRRED